MKIRYLAMVLAAIAAPASARLDPTPKPSGIVVHLFGPNSVMGNVLPTTPAGAATAPSGAPAAAYQEPSMHDVLRQMFVTGDPNQQPGQALAKGRTGDRLSN